jgi:hypothetical protein
MNLHLVNSVALPDGSEIGAWFDKADLADAFAIGLAPADAAKGVDHLARCMLSDPPLWLRTLLRMRDGMVAGFGLKTTGALRRRAFDQGAAHIDFFHVFSRSAHEVIVGEDDRHLDFRASVMLRQTPHGGAELVATTVVHCHNLLGHSYLALIAPLHRFIVKANLQRAARKHWRVSGDQAG